MINNKYFENQKRHRIRIKLISLFIYSDKNAMKLYLVPKDDRLAYFVIKDARGYEKLF